jgi:hypothetical protein
MLGRWKVKAQRKRTMGPPVGGRESKTLNGGAKMPFGKSKLDKSVTSDCLLQQTTLSSNESIENNSPINSMKKGLKQRALRFSISLPALMRKNARGKHGVEGKHGGQGGSSSRFRNSFRKKKDLFNSADLSGRSRKSLTGDKSFISLDTDISEEDEMKNKSPPEQHQLEDQQWLTQEPEDDNIIDLPFFDRIKVFYPIEDEYDSTNAAIETKACSFTMHDDDFPLSTAHSQESIFNNNDSSSKSADRLLQSTHPIKSFSDSFDSNMHRTGSDTLVDLPFKSPSPREGHTLHRTSFSSDDLARYDRTAMMENMASSHWSTDFDFVSHEHNGGLSLAKSRCRSDPNLGERSNEHTALLGHGGTAHSSRNTPFRASPSFECMLDSQQTITICNADMTPAQSSINVDSSGSTLCKKETTPARNSINIDSGFYQFSRPSRSRSDPSAVANTAFATSRSTPPIPASSLETPVDVKRTRSVVVEKTNCLPQEGGNLPANSNLSPTQSLKLDASGKRGTGSASHSLTQSLTLEESGSSADAIQSHVVDLKVHNGGVKVASLRRDTSLDNTKTAEDAFKDPNIAVNNMPESCPNTESTTDGLLPKPSSENFSALTAASMSSSEDGLYLLTSVDVLEVDTNPTPVHTNACLALAANDISRMTRCDMESRRHVSRPLTCERSVCTETTTTTGRYSNDETLTELFLYGCLHPVSAVLPLYIDLCNAVMD